MEWVLVGVEKVILEVDNKQNLLSHNYHPHFSTQTGNSTFYTQYQRGIFEGMRLDTQLYIQMECYLQLCSCHNTSRLFL